MTDRVGAELNLNRYSVVLVGTKIPENIGSVARLLENYQVGPSALVAPNCEYKTGVAQWMATGPSLDRLNQLPVYQDLGEAVQSCTTIVGFTARSGQRRKIELKLEDLAKIPGKIGLVFGREDFCLLKEETDRCTYLCSLDTSVQFPALNLSHSVAVVLSQLFLQEHESRRGHQDPAVLANFAEQEAMFLHLKQVVVQAGLITDGNPDRLWLKIRKILQRAELTREDLSVLRGLYSAILRSSETG
jgi:tRNA/rRNA methyltransferase